MAKGKNEEEKKNRALLNKKAAEALKDLVAQVQFYIQLMSENKDLEKNNEDLIGVLKEIDKELASLSTKAKENSYVDLQQIMSLSNKLNEATDKVNTEKFIPSLEAYKRKFGKRLAGLKDTVSAEAKLLENMQTRMKSGMIKIEESATILRSNTKHPSIWQKFTRAVTNFAKATENKFMSLFRKAPKSKAPPAPPPLPPKAVQRAPVVGKEQAEGVVKSHDQELKSAVGKREERKVYPRLLEKQERDREKQRQAEAAARRKEGERGIQVELKPTKKPDQAPQRPPRTTAPPAPPRNQGHRTLPTPPPGKPGAKGAMLSEFKEQRSQGKSASLGNDRDINMPPSRPPPKRPTK